MTTLRACRIQNAYTIYSICTIIFSSVNNHNVKELKLQFMQINGNILFVSNKMCLLLQNKYIKL